MTFVAGFERGNLGVGLGIRNQDFPVRLVDMGAEGMPCQAEGRDDQESLWVERGGEGSRGSRK